MINFYNTIHIFNEELITRIFQTNAINLVLALLILTLVVNIILIVTIFFNYKLFPYILYNNTWHCEHLFVDVRPFFDPVNNV
jgi:hypothetical protein